MYLGLESYYLYCYINSNSTSADIIRLQKIADNMLLDSSITFEIINIDVIEAHPALDLINSENITSLPFVILVAPDGRSMRFPAMTDPLNSGHEFRSVLRKILHSPTRDKIIMEAAKHYGMVLFIESNNREINQKASGSIQKAIKSITSDMKYMPKPISHPPVVVTLEARDVQDETLLLWSLNLEEHDPQKPYAAVFYGKGRWIGPLLIGEQITEDYVYNILSVIGMDCECGLDRRIIRGTILPAQWSKEIKKMAVTYLGFDPENPIIKTEVSQILRLGYSPSLAESYGQLRSQQNVSLFDSIGTMSAVNGSDTTLSASLEKPSTSLFRNSFVLLIGLSIVVIAIGVFIIFRAAKSNR